MIAALLAVGCSPQQAPAKAAPIELGPPPPVVAKIDFAQSKRVLVVINTNSKESVEVGEYYVSKRQIPADNVLRVSLTTEEEIPEADYKTGLEDKVRAHVKASKYAIDFIVLTKGFPLRLDEKDGYSVDGHLAAMDVEAPPIVNINAREIDRVVSPYFEKNEPFSRKKFGIYLVTRLDGYDVDRCKRLVDNALGAKPEKGPFLLDQAEGKGEGGYKQVQESLYAANQILGKKGYQTIFNDNAEFLVPDQPLAGYASWGSNDSHFDLAGYRRLRFKPGALAETFVSTSGRRFRRATVDKGQSLIADLIDAGVTGVKGYVSEPYTFAMARPQILFDRYTSGFNLAESFYMASPVLKWKDIIIGDPLCAPYKK